MATLEKLEGSKVKLTIEVSADKFEEAIQQAYRTSGKKFNVPGFRKGKAPRKMIENTYGPLAFFDDAFDVVYPEVYQAAVKEHELEVIDRPDISIVELPLDGNNLVFTAEVAVRPEVKLGQYKGIEIEKREYNVTDDEVDFAMQREREKLARMVDVERPVQNGDTVNLDYSGSVSGIKFEGGTAEGATLEIGSHTFIDGFEDQMVGMTIGEEKDINVTFPEQYHSEALAGAEATFHVKVNGIQVKELPELDDEFAKDVSEFDTLEELRASKREELEKQAAERAAIEKENAVVAKVVDNAEVEVPDIMVDRQIDAILNDIRYRLSMQGVSLEDYMKYTGMSMEDFRTQSRPDAERRVKSQLVIDAVAKAENIKAEDADVEAKIDEYVAQFGDKADVAFFVFHTT
ncbi:MAG: trigger factor, partial [Clostridia bacterium]|nr:trigger factor [Clostridia bacterium]